MTSCKTYTHCSSRFRVTRSARYPMKGVAKNRGDIAAKVIEPNPQARGLRILQCSGMLYIQEPRATISRPGSTAAAQRRHREEPEIAKDEGRQESVRLPARNSCFPVPEPWPYRYPFYADVPASKHKPNRAPFGVGVITEHATQSSRSKLMASRFHLLSGQHYNPLDSVGQCDAVAIAGVGRQTAGLGEASAWLVVSDVAGVAPATPGTLLRHPDATRTRQIPARPAGAP